MSISRDETQTEKSKNFKNNLFCSVFIYVSAYFLKIFEDCSDRKDFQNILLPLLVHLGYTNQICQKMEEFDFQSLYQTLLVTINMIENKILREHKCMLYEGNFALNQLQEYLRKKYHKLLNQTTSEEILRKLSILYKKYIHKNVFDNNYVQFHIYWNGVLQFGHEIQREISREIIYFNDLVNYQRFIIKWFVAKILVGIKYYFISLKKEHSSYPNERLDKTTTVFNVMKFVNMEFPMAVQLLLVDTVNMVLKTINPDSMSLDESDYNISLELIDDNLSALDIRENTFLLP